MVTIGEAYSPLRLNIAERETRSKSKQAKRKTGVMIKKSKDTSANTTDVQADMPPPRANRDAYSVETSIAVTKHSWAQAEHTPWNAPGR